MQNSDRIPYDEIDPGVVQVVRALNENGFRTIGACEGGEGHAFSLPTIQIRTGSDLDDTRRDLCRFLLSRGARSFTLRTVCMHQSAVTPERYSYVEVEFWMLGERQLILL